MTNEEKTGDKKRKRKKKEKEREDQINEKYKDITPKGIYLL